MKSAIKNTVAVTLFTASPAYASNCSGSDSSGLFFWLFAGFALIIITFQFMPGITTFLDIAKGLFTSGTKMPEGLKTGIGK